MVMRGKGCQQEWFLELISDAKIKSGLVDDERQRRCRQMEGSGALMIRRR